jgi:hypothetical protein
MLGEHVVQAMDLYKVYRVSLRACSSQSDLSLDQSSALLTWLDSPRSGFFLSSIGHETLNHSVGGFCAGGLGYHPTQELHLHHTRWLRPGLANSDQRLLSPDEWLHGRQASNPDATPGSHGKQDSLETREPYSC